MPVLRSILFAIGFAVVLSGSAGAQATRLDAALKRDLAALEIIRGAPFTAGELDGRAVVVNFFASWCVPCRLEFIELRRLVDTLGPERIKVISINWFEDFGRYPGTVLRLARTLDRIDPRITAVRGTEAMSQAFGGPRGVRGLPALFAFSADGRMAYRYVYDGSTRLYTKAEELLDVLGR